MAAQAGASVSYFDFVTAALGTYLGTPRLVNIISVWAVLCALSLLKQLKSVAWLSAAGLLTYLFVLALLGYFGAEQMVSEGVLPAYQPSALAKPAGLGAWFGPAIFAFEGMGTALSIYEAMEDADPRPFFSVVSSTYLISYVLYGGVGAFGYLAWQGGVCPVIIDCFPTYNTTPGAVNSVNADLAMAAHVALSIILGLSFVLQVHVLPLIASERIPSDSF
jgi:proton-coupled amino acid transporter